MLSLLPGVDSSERRKRIAHLTHTKFGYRAGRFTRTSSPDSRPRSSIAA